MVLKSDEKRREGRIIGYDCGLTVVQFEGKSRPTRHDETRLEPYNLFTKRNGPDRLPTTEPHTNNQICKGV